MAKRTYKTEKAGPSSTNKFLIPKTFNPVEDSFVSTGATSQLATDPFKAVARPLNLKPGLLMLLNLKRLKKGLTLV